MNQESKPLVSIVLPVYNGAKYLPISIESCIAQTYENWELLIVDDGSTDQSADIARSYEEKDARVHYYKNEHNLRLPRNLNKGFSLAKGEYLTWTSDDNYYEPTAIEKMVQALQNKKYGFVFTTYRVVDAMDRKIETVAAPKDYQHAIWAYNFVGACFLYTREVYDAVGEYDPDLFLCEDYDYWLRIFAKFDVAYLEEELYAYRVHDKSLTSTYKEMQFQTLEKVLQKNFKLKEQSTTLEYFHLYRGLNRSRLMEKNVWKRYRYFPKLLCYKLWYEVCYKVWHKVFS